MVQLFIAIAAISIILSIGKVLVWSVRNMLKAALVIMFVLFLLGKI